VVAHGETGLLSEELDIKGMAKNMLELLENPEFAKRLSLNAKLNIERNFTLQKHLNIIENLILKCLK
jgi:colanic acid/amylovoran biosynthesis glycosyltransferase